MNANCGSFSLFLTPKIEAVDGMEHDVAEEAFGAAEGARGGAEVAEFRGAFFQQVGDFELEGERLILQEGLRDGGVDNPLVVVEHGVGEACAGVEDALRVNLHAEGEVHLWRKDDFVGMSVLVVLGRFLIAGVASFVHPVERHAPNILAIAKTEACGGVNIIDAGKSEVVAHGAYKTRRVVVTHVEA